MIPTGMRHKSLVQRRLANRRRPAWRGGNARSHGTRDRKPSCGRVRSRNAVDLLRLILAYCLGERGLRSTAAWATSVGLVDISNVALLYRLRQCGDWLSMLVGLALASAAPKASRGRMIRIIDATTVPKKGRSPARQQRVVAHSQRVRSSAGTLWPLRTDRSAGR